MKRKWIFCVTCAADSSADSRRQNGAVSLSDWLWATNQIKSARCSCPGQTHETGHSRGEVTHLHGLERKWNDNMNLSAEWTL